jgi:hypothetical protein
MLLCAAPAASAHPPKEHDDGGATIAPLDRIAGQSGAQLMAESFALVYTDPPSQTSGCHRRASGVVELLVIPGDVTVDCVIREGTSFFLTFGASCSTAEAPPYFGRDEAEQRACALAGLAEVPRLAVAVDSGPAVDVSAPLFRLGTDGFAVDVVPGNDFDAQSGPATVVAEGWAAKFTLARGRHTIAVLPSGENAAPPATVTVDVRPRCGR